MIKEKEIKRNPLLWEVITIFTIIVALGLPGNYQSILGESSVQVFGYTAFFLQIFVMLSSSASSMYDIQIFNFKQKYLLIYLMLAFFFIESMLVTNFPKEQVIACTRYTVTAMFGLWVADHYSPYKIAELVYKSQVIFIAFTLLLMIIRPSECYMVMNGEQSFVGLFSAKNACAIELCSGLAAQIIMILAKKDKKKRFSPLFYVMIPIQIILFLLCLATGAVFCFLIPAVYILLWARYSKRNRKLSIGILFTAIPVIFLFSLIPLLKLFTPFLLSIGKDPTLTGRTDIWEHIISAMQTSHTFTGYGLSMFWKDPDAMAILHSGFSKYSWYSTMSFGSHNALIEMWTDVGLTGIAIYFITIINAFKNVEYMDDNTYMFSSFYMFIFMISGMTERIYSTMNFQTLFLYIILGIACSTAKTADKDSEKELVYKFAEKKSYISPQNRAGIAIRN